jgi:putative FmdB family regulatory protein
MPLYGYQCNRCNHEFEVRASFREKEMGIRPVCPICQSDDTHQVLSVGLFVRGGSVETSSIQSPYCGPNSGTGCCG